MVGNLYLFFESSLSFVHDGIIANHSLAIIVMVLHWIDNNTLWSWDISVKNTVWNGDNIFYPSALRAGGVLSSRSGRAGGRVGGRPGGRAAGRAAARLAEPISL